MLAKCFLVISFALATGASFSQNTFLLSDSIVEVGETFTAHRIRFDLNKPDLLLDSVCAPALDSITSFIVSHPEIKFEIGVHTDSRGWKYRSSHLTPGRAKSLYLYFLEKGADKSQIVPVGYECHEPIHSGAYINQFKEKDKRKFHQLHQENRRVVLKILTVN